MSYLLTRQRYSTRTLKPARLLLVLITISSLCFLSFFVRGLTKLNTHNRTSRSNNAGIARLSERISVHAAGRGNPTLNLNDGRDLITQYVGPEELRVALEQNRAEPLSLASADFDEDGVPDLVGGYAYQGRGIVTLLRGNVDSIYPNAPEAKQRQANGTLTTAPFLSPARVFDAPEAADFIGAGDFDGDSHWDVIVAARCGTVLHLLPGDGRGGFKSGWQVDLPGTVTTLRTGEVNRRDGLTDVAVGVAGPNGALALVFQGSGGALKAIPEIFQLPSAATSFIMGQFVGDYAMDLAIATGTHLLIVDGRSSNLSLTRVQPSMVAQDTVTDRSFGSSLVDIAPGGFDGDARADIAVLLANGSIQRLSQPSRIIKNREAQRNLADSKIESLATARINGAANLLPVSVSSSGGNDLLVTEPEQESLSVLTGFFDSNNNRGSGQPAWLQLENAPTAILPMQLDVDGLTDLVVLQSTSSLPAVVLTAPGRETPGNGNGVESVTFTNSAPIAITGTLPAPTRASPYPSTITVSGQPSSLDKLRVRLNKFSENLPFDADILLAGPAGQKIILMSDIGRSASNLVITFDDEAGGFVPSDLVSGTFKPTNRPPDDDNFPAPAPAAPYSTTLSAFNGTNPNGVWSLYVIDDNGFSTGSISEGWSLIIGADPHLPITAIVTNTNDSGAGSLRQALLDTNANLGADLITFNIPGTGVKTIRPFSELPPIIDTVTIDGTTQPGFNGTPIIELDGSSVSSGPRGLVDIRSGGCRVRGLVLNRFSGSGFRIQAGSGNIIEGNFIGTDSSGTSDLVTDFGRGVDFYDHAPNNLIGGTTVAARNVIAGNNRGISLEGFQSPGQVVQGNFIGTDLTGAVKIGNSFGIEVLEESNTIGGTTAGAGNVISGNRFEGVQLYDGFNLVQGNLIGTNANGSAAMGNGFFGVEMSRGTSNNTVGGTTVSARNVISGNDFGGVTIGHPDFPEVNVNNIVQGNFIGTDITGINAVANTGDGVQVPNSAEGGGVTDNLIAFNTRAGVNLFTVTSPGFSPGVKIAILDNAIYSNAVIGIDLGDPGITPNDPQDPDVGPNLLQNFPVLTSFAPDSPQIDSSSPAPEEDQIHPGRSTPESTVIVSATLNSTPNKTFTVHWYFSADSQCVTNQAASHPLVTGRIPNVVTNSSGNAAFNFPLDFPAGISNGIVNCTATDSNGNTSEFSACLSVSDGPTPTPTPTPAVQWSAVSYAAGENVGSVQVSVTRTGSTAGAATVNYASSDTAGASNCNVLNSGVANSRCDYEATAGTLKFAAGEASKTILIPFVDDVYAEGNENFTVTLSNATGVSLGTPSVATVTINDNETTTGTNPINVPSFFVRLHYVDFFTREPDSGGLAFWTDQITSCGTDQACVDIRRINVSAAFYLSIEFQDTGYLVYRFYKAAYGNIPNGPVPVRFNEFLPDTQQIGQGVVVGQPGWEQVLENNKVAFATDFVLRSRFTSAYPTTLTPAQYVDALFTNAVVTPSSTDRTAAINEFGGAGNTSNTAARGRALRRVAENAILKQQETNKAFVLMQYFGYLRRNPYDPPEAGLDFGGFNFWLGKLNQFNGNFVNAEMVKAFIVSGEYKGRFGP